MGCIFPHLIPLALCSTEPTLSPCTSSLSHLGTLLDLWSENSSSSMTFGGIFHRCLWNPSYCSHTGKVRETVDMQEQCDCESKNSNLPHYWCCPCSEHQYRELNCQAVCSFTQISCTGSSSQFYSCFAQQAATLQKLSASNFIQSAVNGLRVKGLLIQKSLKITTTDTYQTEVGSSVKFLHSERLCLYRSDIFTSKDIKHLAYTLNFFFIILSANSHSAAMH